MKKEQEKCSKGKKKFSWKKFLLWFGGSVIVIGGTVYLYKSGKLQKVGKKVKSMLPGKKNNEVVYVDIEEDFVYPVEKKGHWRRQNNWTRSDKVFGNNSVAVKQNKSQN